MTSKEALKHIIKEDYNMILTSYPPIPAYDSISKNDMIKIIEKDLEVLDILRRILLNENNSPYIKIENGNVCIDVTAPINEKDCDKLKEWLNYDK